MRCRQVVCTFSLAAMVAAIMLVPGVALGQELLTNPGFEDAGHGETPRPPWAVRNTPPEAWALTTGTAAHTGTFGLWAYTYEGTASSYSETYQRVSAVPGEVYNASAYVRSTPVPGGGSWVEGSSASVRVNFLSGSYALLATHESAPVTEASSGWTEPPASVTTDPAPPSTAWVEFVLRVEKPGGVGGQSVANFDDCSLSLVEVPVLDVSPMALGFGLQREELPLVVTNIGAGTLMWSISDDADWLSVSEVSGETTTESDTVLVQVSRTGLPPDTLLFEGELHLTSNAGDADVCVYMEYLASATVPAGPSTVWTDGYRVWVQRRRPDGSLDPAPMTYPIFGVCWSPASVGTLGDPLDRQSEFALWYELDIQMLRAMCANTVYVFLDFGTSETAFDILDYLYLNGMTAIVTVDWDGTHDLANLETIVNAYKDHPAVLMWAIGNEWNINLYHETFTSLMDAAEATETAAQLVKSLDPDHPVATIFGEIEILPDQPLSLTETIVNDVCPSVDVWGLNIYRGASFGNLFEQWESVSAKPMFLSEFGTDSYFSTYWWPVEGYVDEAMQATFNRGLVDEVLQNLSSKDLSGVCAGCTVFEWCDEWWKTGDPLVHEPDGYETWWNPAAFPDGFGNEEYFGIVNIDRTKKEAYFVFPDCLWCPTTGVEDHPEEEEGSGDAVSLSWSRQAVQAGSVGSAELTLPTATRVRLSLFNAQGRLVRVLLDGEFAEGRHTVPWDGRDARGMSVASGVYFLQANAGSSSASLKIVLVR